MPELSPNQLSTLVTTERVNSCVSLVGIFFILATYIFAPSFDKPINRLIFFASWGNIGSCLASLISEAGPQSVPTENGTSPLCQFQAFLVQMFLGVDCYWAFFMAVNVYLVFFRGYTVQQLRTLDHLYLLACYGLAFIPALIFIFISTPSRHHIYGPAIIWCWISPRWDFMRLVFLYGIVWIAMLLAFIVYGMAGKVIWMKRQHLKGFLNPLNENPFTVTTEIEITHEERLTNKDANSHDTTEMSTDAEGFDPYSVNIRGDPQSRQEHYTIPNPLHLRTLTRDVAQAETNAEGWLYARVAFLFFFALLITWVPSSVNRLYALAKPNVINFPLNYISSLVFPLQGFWNCVVYIITSQTACRRLWRDVIWRRSNNGSTLQGSKADSTRRLYPNTGKQRLRSETSLAGPER